MQIGIIGASGNIGQRIRAEALARGHRITAFTRDASRTAGTDPREVWKVADVMDAEGLRGAIGGLDLLVSAYGPGNAARDFNGTVEQSIRHPGAYVTAAKAILAALESHPALRLIVVGGAGSLEVRPGLQLVDMPDFAIRLTEIGVPAGYRAAVLAHRDALDLYRVSNRNWTYLSPAGQIYPGERTGRFRLGGDQLIVDADGRSRISYEDYAVALLDEAELPRHIQRRFTAAY